MHRHLVTFADCGHALQYGTSMESVCIRFRVRLFPFIVICVALKTCAVQENYVDGKQALLLLNIIQSSYLQPT